MGCSQSRPRFSMHLQQSLTYRTVLSILLFLSRELTTVFDMCDNVYNPSGFFLDSSTVQELVFIDLFGVLRRF